MFIIPDWPIPKNIKALCTTRQGGVSKAPFDSLNMATHVEDVLSDVMQNRALIQQKANLPSEPVWLNQQHTDIALELTNQSSFAEPVIADASWTQSQNVVCVVMTADCLPILLTDKQGSCVAAIHAGWKGLADKIVSQTIQKMPVEPSELMAWIGPAISARQFEVGQDVFDAFALQSSDNTQFFYQQSTQSSTKFQTVKYLADLPGLVSLEMQKLGLTQIHKSNLCSYEDNEQFFSYRRHGKTGRMASMIWIEESRC
ncbi:peptidoglycan editing factor PgeF [Thiomicrorhabdus sp. Milos-T2]|uniref:peptidoglycan editing factor PgeF n=1 Tax=Thiomicrorhabdus sp. Milos-T2 TaxID=90814 RepID=UPI00049449D0|nr:peptidoglycan editing factor PgeF [Thiomicrorhabdus sp. Milos-T2]